MDTHSKDSAKNADYINILKPKTNTEIANLIIVENLNDDELLAIVDECQKDCWEENSIIRTLSKQYFGNDSLLEIMFVANKILPVVAKRMKCYSPHVSKATFTTLTREEVESSRSSANDYIL